MRDRFTPQQLALLVAVGADVLQVVAFPLFFAGGASVFEDVLDVVVMVALTRLLGFHLEFLPSMAAELIPGMDLIPFWTAAVLLVVRRMHRPAAEPPVLDQTL